LTPAAVRRCCEAVRTGMVGFTLGCMRIGCPESSAPSTVEVVGPQWKGRNKPHRGDRRWVSAWSPEQIANRLKVDFPEDESMRISHEAIY